MDAETTRELVVLVGVAALVIALVVALVVAVIVRSNCRVNRYGGAWRRCAGRRCAGCGGAGCGWCCRRGTAGGYGE
jgi:hypothetical protein